MRGLGCPVKFDLSPGQAHDITKAHDLVDGLTADFVIADTAYDADHFREAIKAKQAEAVIPNNPSRALRHPIDKALYKERHLVECCFNKLKNFRRIATRYDKTALSFLAMITVAAIAIWLR